MTLSAIYSLLDLKYESVVQIYFGSRLIYQGPLAIFILISSSRFKLSMLKRSVKNEALTHSCKMTVPQSFFTNNIVIGCSNQK